MDRKLQSDSEYSNSSSNEDKPDIKKLNKGHKSDKEDSGISIPSNKSSGHIQENNDKSGKTDSISSSNDFNRTDENFDFYKNNGPGTSFTQSPIDSNNEEESKSSIQDINSGDISKASNEPNSDENDFKADEKHKPYEESKSEVSSSRDKSKKKHKKKKRAKDYKEHDDWDNSYKNVGISDTYQSQESNTIRKLKRQLDDSKESLQKVSNEMEEMKAIMRTKDQKINDLIQEVKSLQMQLNDNNIQILEKDSQIEEKDNQIAQLEEFKEFKDIFLRCTSQKEANIGDMIREAVERVLYLSKKKRKFKYKLLSYI